MVEICCTYPIEYTKTMQQLATTKMGAMDVVKDTLKKSGPFGMYRGLESMVYFATPKAAIRFSSKEAFSNMLPKELGKAKGFLAGLGAGTCEAIFVTTPQETIKIKLIDDMFKSATPRFNGFFHGVATIVKEDGIAACYLGLGATIFKVATAQATRFGVFEVGAAPPPRSARPLHARRRSGPPRASSLAPQVVPAEFRNQSPIHTAASGAFAGAVSVLAFQGVDVVKSRMQGLDAAKYSSTMDCARQLYAEGGMGALYKGVGPRITRVMFEVAITMSLYGEVGRGT